MQVEHAADRRRAADLFQRVARLALSAAARMVQVARWSAHAVARAEIPKSLRSFQEAEQVYCDTLAEKADVLETFAIDAAAACRDLSSTRSFLNRLSRFSASTPRSPVAGWCR